MHTTPAARVSPTVIFDTWRGNCHSYATGARSLLSGRVPQLSELSKKRLCLLQILGVEAFGEPAIERCEEVADLSTPALLTPKPGEARCRTQLIGSGLLPPRDPERLLQRCLAFVNFVVRQQYHALETVEL